MSVLRHPQQKIILKAMSRLKTIICFLVAYFFSTGLLCSEAPKLSQPKKSLIEQVQIWVAKETDVDSSNVEVGAMDRRFIVPSCPTSLDVSFPFAGNHQSVRVDCHEIEWKAFLRVTIHRFGETYVYRQDLPIDHPLRLSDIKPKKVKMKTQGLVTNPEEIALKSLRKSVKAGDLVRLQHLAASVKVFRLKEDVLVGEPLKLENIEEILRPKNKTLMTERLPERLFKKAIAARDLARGHILQKRDIKERHRALIAQVTLTRGQALSLENARIENYFGRLPADAIVSDSSLGQLEVTRTIQAGNLLRMSDVKEADLIKRSDTVILRVGRGSLLITVPMKALESGKLGEQIKLLNPESGETVIAEVSGPRMARAL